MTDFRCATPEDLPGLIGLWKTAFGDSEEFIRMFLDTAFAPERSRVAVSEEGLTAMLFWFDCSLNGQPWAYIYAVATAPEARGKGIASALLEDTHAHLARQGYHLAILSPGSADLFRFYEKRGYRTAGFLTEETVSAGAPCPLHPLKAEAYGRARRDLLPPDGVVQEGENLAYLHRFASLWGGEGWIGAVSRHDGTVLEFLGDPGKIPGLLGALNIPCAKVRRPGGARPMAMAHSLDGSPLPGGFYFGLPFD